MGHGSQLQESLTRSDFFYVDEISAKFSLADKYLYKSYHWFFNIGTKVIIG